MIKEISRKKFVDLLDSAAFIVVDSGNPIEHYTIYEEGPELFQAEEFTRDGVKKHVIDMEDVEKIEYHYPEGAFYVRMKGNHKGVYFELFNSSRMTLDEATAKADRDYSATTTSTVFKVKSPEKFKKVLYLEGGVLPWVDPPQKGVLYYREEPDGGFRIMGYAADPATHPHTGEPVDLYGVLMRYLRAGQRAEIYTVKTEGLDWVYGEVSMVTPERPAYGTLGMLAEELKKEDEKE